MRGLTLRRIEERRTSNRTAITKAVPPKVTDICNGCGLCMRVCIFDAIKIEDKVMTIDEEKCYGCGLCVNVCGRSGSLLMPYFEGS